MFEKQIDSCLFPNKFGLINNSTQEGVINLKYYYIYMNFLSHYFLDNSLIILFQKSFKKDKLLI